MVTPSRRTEPSIVKAAAAALEGTPHRLWDMEGENPYPQFLAHADLFLAPADSVNMTGEPCATGKPVYVFYPDGGSPKFTRFHKALEATGATRPLPSPLTAIESWTYPPVSSAEVIAEAILRRWKATARPQPA